MRYIVITEDWYGGENKIKAFNTIEEAVIYGRSLTFGPKNYGLDFLVFDAHTNEFAEIPE